MAFFVKHTFFQLIFVVLYFKNCIKGSQRNQMKN
jgi:hypothetical protein